MGEAPKGKVVVIAGPTGVGKNSIIEGVLERCANCADLVTATTRAPRAGEQEGADYFFMSEEQFDKNVSEGNILEVFRHPAGFRNGTYAPYINEHLMKGETVLGDITFSGAHFLKERFHALAIFVMPPAFGILEQRIRARHANMPPAELEKRLALAKKEMEEESPWYDYRVVNEEGKLDRTVSEVIEILKKEGYL
jgi:guanylate kinase